MPNARDGDRSLMPLLLRARTGDNEAREQLFARCRSYICLVARARVESWCRAKVDPSDLVQQTLLDVHRGLAGFRGTTDAEWFAWLRQVLGNNTVDFVRKYRGTEKRAVQREVSLENMPLAGEQRGRYDPPDSLDSPSEFLIRHERDLQIADAVLQLPADYQEVIVLRNMQRLSFNEVADRMQRSRAAVQMLWLRALKLLGERLKNHDEA